MPLTQRKHNKWRWRHDLVPRTPEENMAVDEAFLVELQGQAQALPVVRVYAWDRPCVSIGRLQEEAAVREVYPALPLVRRPTGGRAVVHGRDLVVSVAARVSDLPPEHGTSLLATYQLIASGLAHAFQALGMDAVFGSAAPKASGSVECFASAARCDLIDAATGRKLAGCAQRRQGTVLLQQMSIPFETIPCHGPFIQQLKTNFEERLGITVWEPSP